MMEEKNSGLNPRMILAMVVVLVFWVGWQQYMTKKYPDAYKPTSSAQTATTTEAPPSPQSQTEVKQAEPQKQAPAIATASKVAAVEVPVTFEDELRKVVLTNRGGRISQIVLKQFKDRKKETLSLFGHGGEALNQTLEGDTKTDWSSAYFQILKKQENVFELTAEEGGLRITKTLTFIPKSYIIEVAVRLSGALQGVKSLGITVEEAMPPKPQSAGFFSLSQDDHLEMPEFFVLYGTKENRALTSHGETISAEYKTAQLSALNFHYFSNILTNTAPILPDHKEAVTPEKAKLTYSYPILDASKDQLFTFKYFAGPKRLEDLAPLGDSAKNVIEFGKFSFIGYPMLSVLKGFYNLVGNWGVAIIFLTLLVRLLVFPFTYASMRSMKGMQKIQPEMNRIKELYKGDKAKLNQEMLELMRKNKVNPMGGCLPMLLQIPVFFALWQVLQNSVELYQAPFAFWLQDLSVKDPYFVLPIAMAIAMYIQQKITPNTMDPDQAKVMMWMPVIFSLFMINTPSGLTLYIFVSTLFGIVQQRLMLSDSANKSAKPVRA